MTVSTRGCVGARRISSQFPRRVPHSTPQNHLRLRQNYFFAAQTEIYLPDEFDEGAKRHKLEARCFGIKANVLAAIKVRADGAEEEASTILGGI